MSPDVPRVPTARKNGRPAARWINLLSLQQAPWLDSSQCECIQAYLLFLQEKRIPSPRISKLPTFINRTEHSASLTPTLEWQFAGIIAFNCHPRLLLSVSFSVELRIIAFTARYWTLLFSTQRLFERGVSRANKLRNDAYISLMFD